MSRAGKKLSPEKPTLTVGPHTTLGDLPPASRSRPSTLAARQVKGQGIVLRWSYKRPPPKHETDLAKTTLRTILANTIARAGLDATNPLIQSCAAYLQRQPDILPIDLVVTSNNLYRVQVGIIQKSDTKQQVAKVPTESIATWLDHLEVAALAAEEGTPAGDAIRTQRDQSRAAWMKHDLTVDATRDHLLHAAEKCEIQMPELAKVAQSLAKDLTRHGEEGPPNTRLHDNLNGRVWESAFAAELVKHRIERVQTATHRLCSFVADQLDLVPDNELPLLHAKLRRDDVGRARSWSADRPQPLAFTTIRDPAAAIDNLKSLLRREPLNMMDCVALLYVAQRVSINLKRACPAVGVWAKECDENYNTRIHPAKSQAYVIAAELTMGPGITMKHQPRAVPLVSTDHPALARVMPSLDDPDDVNHRKLLHPAVQTQLHHGGPYVSGAAGTINLLSYLADHANLTANAQIEKDYAMLGTLVMMKIDGGHSLWEGLVSMDQIRNLKGEAPAAGTGTLDTYVPDYNAYIESIDDPQVAGILRQAADAAFAQLTAYRAKHLGPATAAAPTPTPTPNPTSSMPGSAPVSMDSELDASARLTFEWLKRNGS